MKKISLALIYGGKSAEHEVSLQSARSIVSAIDHNKYDLHLIGIDKKGKWYLNDKRHFLPQQEESIPAENDPVEVSLMNNDQSAVIVRTQTNTPLSKIDVVFPILHGPYGEDGTIQGLLKFMNIAFVGPDVLGSAIGMDKDVAKRLLRDAGIPIARYAVVMQKNRDKVSFEKITSMLGLPLFVKPANAGSSVGVHKVDAEDAFYAALDDAFQFDSKLLVEEAITGREVECAILGNESPMASVVGEIIPSADFYSYNAKYIDEHGARLVIPADIEPDVAENIRQTALKAFETLCCEGLSRVDFFLKPDHSLVLNEINTIPGFTKVSMYPKLWEASGISYSDLIDKLIQFAIERHDKQIGLKTSV